MTENALSCLIKNKLSYSRKEAKVTLKNNVLIGIETSLTKMEKAGR